MESEINGNGCKGNQTSGGKWNRYGQAGRAIQCKYIDNQIRRAENNMEARQVRRILCVGRLGKWALVDEGAHPLPASARRHLEALWPQMEAEPLTVEECERWFAVKFENKERVTDGNRTA